MSAVVKGIDLDLLLEDLALTKRRISELEDNQKVIMSNQEVITDFLVKSFPKKGRQLRKLLRDVGPTKEKVSLVSVFGQADDGLSDRDAIIQCMIAQPVSNDSIDHRAGISFPKKKPEISAKLRG